MNGKNYSLNNSKWVYIFLTIYLYVINRYGITAMLVSAVLVFLMFAINCKGVIPFKIDQRLAVYLFSFSVLCLVSSLWAKNASYAADMGIRMIEISAITLFFYICFCEETSLNGILKAFMYSGYGISLYVIYVSGWSVLYQLVLSAQRITSYQIDTLNANTIGAIASYSLLINLYFIIYVYKKIRVTDILMFPALLTLMASQSRKAFITIILGTLMLLILKNFDRTKIFKTFISLIIIFGGTFLLIKLCYNLPIFNLINERLESMITSFTEGQGDATLRVKYIELGLTLFEKYPIFGVGCDNAKVFNLQFSGHEAYLHNNFVELLADVGLVGTIIYYSIYAVILLKFIKYRNYRDEEYDICLVLLTIRLLMDFGQITYYGKDNAFYILMFWLEVQKLERKSQLENSIPRSVIVDNILNR